MAYKKPEFKKTSSVKIERHNNSTFSKYLNVELIDIFPFTFARRCVLGGSYFQKLLPVAEPLKGKKNLRGSRNLLFLSLPIF